MTGYLYRGLPWLEEINAEIMAAREGGRTPRQLRGDYHGCGTAAGYTRHRRRGEQACRRCLDAANAARRTRADSWRDMWAERTGKQ